jgi:FlgD Ig-like domain
MSRRFLVVVALVAVALTCPTPVAAAPSAAAEVVPTTTTMVSVTSPAYVAGYATYVAAVAPPEATGSVMFEVSRDNGDTWENLSFASPQGGGTWSAAFSVGTTEETRLVRAAFTSSGEYAPSTSDGLTQVLTRRTTRITSFTATDDGFGSTIRPGTTPVWLTVTIDGKSPYSPAQVSFEEDVAGTWVGRGDGALVGANTWRLTLTSLAEGTHTFRATYPGDDWWKPVSATLEVPVAKGTPTVTIGGPDQVQANHRVTLYPSVGGGPGSVVPSGTLTLLCDGAVVGSIEAPGGEVDAGLLPLGLHVFTAAYEGDASFSAANSDPFTVQVVSDVVEATARALAPTTFYPYRDGYRDTVKASGTRAEPASVAFVVKNGSGRTVRTASVALGSGAYAWAWNGRTASGTRVPAGRYTIRTTYHDAAGTAKTVSQTVTVSSKRLYWSSTTLTRTGSQTLKRTSSWGAWQFTMPTATVYRNLRLTIWGYADIAFYRAGFGAQDTRSCAWSTISPDCTSGDKDLPTMSLSSASVALNAYRHKGRSVRAYAWLAGARWMRIAKLRLRVEYGILR